MTIPAARAQRVSYRGGDRLKHYLGRMPEASQVPTRLTNEFERALSWAIELHKDQVRKGTKIPYVSHLLGVASLVLEDDGTEEEAIAALLHDAVEDCMVVRGDFEAKLGPDIGSRVFDIVVACSDGGDPAKDARDEETWQERKTSYVNHLNELVSGDAALRVSVADKLHNARAILSDLREYGPDMWQKFNAGESAQLWYYNALSEVFNRIHNRPISRELANVVEQIGHIVNTKNPNRSHC